MKSLFPLLFQFLLISLVCDAQVEDCIIANFPFNNSSNLDNSSFGVSTINEGATFGFDRFFNPNSAIAFPGGADQVRVEDPDFGNFGISDFSISLWVRTQSPDFERFIGKRENCAPGSYWDCFITDAGRPGFVIDGGADARIYLEGDADLTDNQWYHLTFVRSGNTILIYLGCELLAQKSNLNIAAISNTSPLLIGNNACANIEMSGYYSGAIDDLYFFDCALSPDEISQVCQWTVYPEVDPIDDCISSEFNFNGTFQDSSINNLTVSNDGAILVEDRFGNLEQAVGFPAGPDQVIVQDADYGNFGTNDFSIAVWLRTNSSEFERFIGKRETCTDGSYWDISVTDEGYPSMIINETSDSKIILTPEIDIADNEWHHVVFVRVDNTLRGYVDCELITTKSAVAVADITNTSNLLIGNNACANIEMSGYYSGDLDDLYILDCALSSTQVNEICQLSTVVSTNEVMDTKIILYPNPTTHWIQLDFSNDVTDQGPLRYTIQNLNGRTLKTGLLQQPRLFVDDLSGGMYLLHIQTKANQTVFTEKFVITK